MRRYVCNLNYSNLKSSEMACCNIMIVCHPKGFSEVKFTFCIKLKLPSVSFRVTELRVDSSVSHQCSGLIPALVQSQWRQWLRLSSVMTLITGSMCEHGNQENLKSSPHCLLFSTTQDLKLLSHCTAADWNSQYRWQWMRQYVSRKD